MPKAVRRIGLSLGADTCWPICYREVLKRLDLSLRLGRETVSFEVKDVTIEPFNLQGACQYDLVIDRLTHWYHTTREWIKKAVLLDGLYVFNNPWSVQSMEKQTTYTAMMRLGLPVPETWMIPPKEYEPQQDLQVTLERYAQLFDLGEVGKKLGYPMFMKPYDGGAWAGVSRIDDEAALRESYDKSGKKVMHLQKAVEPFDIFARCIGLGPQVRFVRYDPSAPHHDRYTMDRGFLDEEDSDLLRNMTLTINAFFGWDFNSCEALRRAGVWHPIDFANPCPDSQVTSLHYHFPWLIMANVRWSVFCAATKRPFRFNLDWKPFLRANKEGMTLREKLEAYGAIARKRLDADRFEEFCAKHLARLPEVADEFFGSDAAKEAVRQKVAALFPEHEVGEFTELFWKRIQTWRAAEGVTGAAAREGGES